MVKAHVLESKDLGSIIDGGFLEAMILQLVMEDLEGGHPRVWN